MNVPALTSHPSTDDRISVETFEADRLARRLALLEESIAEGERALRGGVDPRTGHLLRPATGGLRAQLLSNLSTERALVERIRSSMPAGS